MSPPPHNQAFKTGDGDNTQTHQDPLLLSPEEEDRLMQLEQDFNLICPPDSEDSARDLVMEYGQALGAPTLSDAPLTPPHPSSSTGAGHHESLYGVCPGTLSFSQVVKETSDNMSANGSPDDTLVAMPYGNADPFPSLLSSNKLVPADLTAADATFPQTVRVNTFRFEAPELKLDGSASTSDPLLSTWTRTCDLFPATDFSLTSLAGGAASPSKQEEAPAKTSTSSTESQGKPRRSRKRAAEIQIPEGCDEETAKKLRRKQRNREAAQQSRDRQKQFIDDLTGRLDTVTAECTKLKQELVAARTENHLLRRENKTLKDSLDSTRSMSDLFTKPLSMSSRTRATAAGGVLMMVLFGISLMVQMSNPDAAVVPVMNMGQIPFAPHAPNGMARSGVRALPASPVQPGRTMPTTTTTTTTTTTSAPTATATSDAVSARTNVRSLLGMADDIVDTNTLVPPARPADLLTCARPTTPSPQNPSEGSSRVARPQVGPDGHQYLHLRVPADTLSLGHSHGPAASASSTSTGLPPLPASSATASSSARHASRRFVHRRSDEDGDMLMQEAVPVNGAGADEAQAGPTQPAINPRGGHYRVLDLDEDEEDSQHSQPQQQQQQQQGNTNANTKVVPPTNTTSKLIASADDTSAQYVNVRCQVVDIDGRGVGTAGGARGSSQPRRPHTGRIAGAVADVEGKGVDDVLNNHNRM